jgi:hypothetical protein
MLGRTKLGGALAVSVVMMMSLSTNSASAITVELAKKCNGLTAQAFPPRVVGNPAAGSAKGSALDQRTYFNKCVTNNGKVDDDAPKDTPKPAK